MIEIYFFGGTIEGMDTSEGAPVVVVELAVVGGGGGGGPVVVVVALGAELVVEALLEEDAGGAVEGGGVEAALRGEGDDFERGRDVWGFHGAKYIVSKTNT